MSPEHPERPDGADSEPRQQVADAASERTGVPAVDRVLAEVESVGSLPVGERVAVFERAHDALRHALDAGDEATSVHDVAGR